MLSHHYTVHMFTLSCCSCCSQCSFCSQCCPCSQCSQYSLCSQCSLCSQPSPCSQHSLCSHCSSVALIKCYILCSCPTCTLYSAWYIMICVVIPIFCFLYNPYTPFFYLYMYMYMRCISVGAMSISGLLGPLREPPTVHVASECIMEMRRSATGLMSGWWSSPPLPTQWRWLHQSENPHSGPGANPMQQGYSVDQ